MKLAAGISVLQIFFAFSYGKNTNVPCEDDQFYDTDSGKCTMCSQCPENSLVVNLCGLFWDIKCQPLSGFKLAKDIFSGRNLKPTTSKTRMFSQDPTEGERLDGEYWYTVSMVLFGILFFICFCIIAYIITKIVRRKKNKERQLTYNPVLVRQQDDDDEPRYIDVFRHRQKQQRSWITSGLPLLAPKLHSENIYINCMEYLPEASEDKRKEDDYVYLES